MKEGFEKFRELLLTDEEFRAKLKKAGEAYTGEHTEESLFYEILAPLAAEYGITADYEEYKAYAAELEDKEMSADELSQVAGGGKGFGGFGANLCLGIGVGAGVTTETLCFAVGWGNPGACAIEGAWVDFGDDD